MNGKKENRVGVFEPGNNVEMSQFSRDQKLAQSEEVKDEVELTFADAVEVNGLYGIFAAGSPLVRRIFWMMVILIGIAVAIAQIIQQVILYFQYPVSTSVTLTNENGIYFPRVTICNENPFLRSLLPSNIHMNESSFANYMRQAMSSGHFNALEWSTFYKENAHALEEMLLGCSIAGYQCSADNFTGIFTDIGYCYTFNEDVENPLLITHAGRSFGLTLKLNAQTEEYLPTTKYAGFVVMLHDQREPPTNTHHTVNIGTYTTFSLQRVVVNHLEPPYGDCGRADLTYTDDYSELACDLECSVSYILDACGCHSLVLNVSDATTCNPIEVEECMQPALEDFDAAGSPCKLDCPVDCQYVYYNHEMTFTTFSDGFLENLVREYGRNTSYWAKNFVQVNVHYGHLLELIVTPSPLYTSSILFCDLGGALGLILGASIINVLQLLDFSCMWLIYKKGYNTKHPS